MRRSPSYDSDEDDMSPPREVRKSAPSPMTTSSPVLLLPTRWCDEYRSPHLSVCGNGRELIYQGELLLCLCSESVNPKEHLEAPTRMRQRPVPPFPCPQLAEYFTTK